MNANYFEDLRSASTAQLVLAAQAGRRDAFGELFERYERHVFVIALQKLGNHNDAQEVCQEVFVQAMLKLGQLRQPECFGGWLRSITHRMAINHATRRPNDTSADPETLKSTCVDKETPLEAALAGERGEFVHAALAQLRELDRRTLEAFYFQGQTLLEMCDEFDAPLGTIKRRLHVARKRLARQVESLVAV